MSNRDLKRIAWISIPAFICTDRFIIPEVAKHYIIDYYILSKFNEKIDFLDSIREEVKNKQYNIEVVNINLRNSDLRIIREYMRVIKRIKEKRYDLVYSILFGNPYYMILLRMIIGNQNVLIGVHNVHVPKGGTKYIPSKIYNWFTIKSFRFFQTFSNSQKKELQKVAHKKYCSNVNFVLMDYGRPTIQKTGKEIVFLTFGYIRKYKRIDVLIKAAQIVYEKTDIPFKVIIAGNCDNWETYEQMIKNPKLFDLRIRRIDETEVPNLFAEADYFVAPYQDIAQSGSAIIALNYDLPIIASKLDAFEDYVQEGKTGFIIEPASLEQLVEKMTYIVQNHEVIGPILKKNVAQCKYKQFSREGVAKLYCNNFEMVMKGELYLQDSK